METWFKKSNPDIRVQAVRVNEDNVIDVAKSINAELVEEIDPEHPEEKQWGLNVRTPSGVKRASLGMYVGKFASSAFISHVRPFEEKYAPLYRTAPPPESIGDSRKARGFADPFEGRRQ